MNAKKVKLMRKSLKNFSKDLNNNNLYTEDRNGTKTLRKLSLKSLYKELKKSL